MIEYAVTLHRKPPGRQLTTTCDQGPGHHTVRLTPTAMITVAGMGERIRSPWWLQPANKDGVQQP
ncbi:Uncharacterised protein [Mycobacterium tuberculosis]|nr:Uncharacterised protein [Mycobacterium tuberculosis]